MFSVAQSEALQKARSGISDENRRQLLTPTLPDKYTLRDLGAYLATAHAAPPEVQLAVFAVIDTALNDERLAPTEDPMVVSLLCNGIIGLLSPDGHYFDSEHPNYTGDETAKSQLRSASLLALKCLARLLEIYSSSKVESATLSTPTLRLLLAYGNSEDVWSSKESSEVVHDILTLYGQRAYSAQFITQDILQDYIRPLFKNSRPSTVTEQGRKATVERLPNERPTRLFDPVKNPWRFQEVAAITIFRWAIMNSDKELMFSNWHLFIPPVLTLLDDPNTQSKLSGMAALSDLLDKVPPKLLEQTGLGEIMEEAMIPTLSFLPTLTPVDESLLLLNAAYDTLQKLTDVRFWDEKSKQKKQKVLDKILREGVLHGIHHCHQNNQIIRLLLTVMEKLINRMEIQAIKHLKDIIPILNTLLMDTFAPTSPANLLQAIKVLQATVTNCWPVLSEDRHRIELVRAMTVCWLHVNDELANSGSQRNLQLREAQQQLKTTAALLSKAMPADSEFQNDVLRLLKAEPKLAALFNGVGEGPISS